MNFYQPGLLSWSAKWNFIWKLKPFSQWNIRRDLANMDEYGLFARLSLLSAHAACTLRTLACSHDFASDIDRLDQVFSAWAAPKHLTRISCLFNCVAVFHIWRTFHVPGEHSTSFLCVHPTKLQVMCLKLCRISAGHRLNQDEVLQSMRVVLPAWCLRYR